MKTTPTYNLSVVVRETGIKPDTLRAWERRYGLPEPSRTEGGHRLYSERDIATVKWLVERQEKGLRVSHAVDLWNQIVRNGQDPLLVNPIGSPSKKIETLQLEDAPAIIELKNRWVNACIQYDELSAENAINQAFALYPVETVCFDILLAGLSEIGDAWHVGKASVQQEHFASSLVIRRLNALLSVTPSPTKPAKILVACPPGEQHTISPLTISLILRRRGWGVVYLGANVPISRFKETVDAVTPHLVVMTAQQLTSAASLLETANFLATNKYRLAFGGLVFNQTPQIQEMIPGNFLGHSLKNAADIIEEIMISPPPIPDILRGKETYQNELEKFIEMRPAIEYQVANKMHFRNIEIDHIETVNYYLSQNIVAIIILGSSEYITPELSWFEESDNRQEINFEYIRIYISEYDTIAQKLLGDESKNAIAALEKIMNLLGDKE